MGDVLLAQDDLQGAQNSYEQSLALRKELGEKGGIANSQVSLATVAIENNQPAQAESLARSAAQEFATENDADQRAAAEDVLAQALIAQERLEEAKREIETARKLVLHDVPTNISLAITGAILYGKTGEGAKAQREIEDAENQAARKKLVALQWRARLAIAELQITAGKIAAARANAQLVEVAATRLGYRLRARTAVNLLKSIHQPG
jgi:hypothetical protein